MDRVEVVINRLVLEGLDVTPDAAERLRDQVEESLARLLRQDGWGDRITSGETERVDAPPLQLNEAESRGRLAESVAQSVAQALQGKEGG